MDRRHQDHHIQGPSLPVIEIDEVEAGQGLMMPLAVHTNMLQTSPRHRSISTGNSNCSLRIHNNSFNLLAIKVGVLGVPGPLEHRMEEEVAANNLQAMKLNLRNIQMCRSHGHSLHNPQTALKDILEPGWPPCVVSGVSLQQMSLHLPL